MGWKCKVCLVTNDDDVNICVCCESPKEANDPKKDDECASGPIFNFDLSSKSETPIFKFGVSSADSSFSKNNGTIPGDQVFGMPTETSTGFVPSFGNNSDLISSNNSKNQNVHNQAKAKDEMMHYYQEFEANRLQFKSLVTGNPGAKVALKNSGNNESSANIPLGTVWVWGSGECDQLGIEESLLDEELSLKEPMKIEKLSNEFNIVDISSGALHNLVLTDKGEVISWGCNDDGALGRLSLKLKLRLEKQKNCLNEDEDNDRDEDNLEGSEDQDDEEDDEDGDKYPNKVIFPEGSEVRVKSIVCGDCYSCCLTEDGEIYLWGSYKDSGGYIGFPNYQLMSGSLIGFKQHTPIKIPMFGMRKSNRKGKKMKLEEYKREIEVEAVKTLVGGENHTIVITESNRIFAWGSTEFGQLGVEPLEDKMAKTSFLYPIELTNESLSLSNHLEIQDIYCGRATTFFVVKNTIENCLQVFACGRNGRNELGILLEEDQSVINPIVIKPRRVNFHNFDLNCAVCKSDKPIRLIGGGQFYSALLTCCGEVYVWGMRECCGLENQLIKNMVDESKDFDPKEKDIKSPTKIYHLKDIVGLWFGADSCFASDTSGLLYVWGMNLTGQIGIGDLKDSDVVMNPHIIDPRSFTSGNGCDTFNFVLKASGGSQHSIALVWNGLLCEPEAHLSKDFSSNSDKEKEESMKGSRTLKRMNAKSFDDDFKSKSKRKALLKSEEELEEESEGEEGLEVEGNEEKEDEKFTGNSKTRDANKKVIKKSIKNSGSKSSARTSKSTVTAKKSSSKSASTKSTTKSKASKSKTESSAISANKGKTKAESKTSKSSESAKKKKSDSKTDSRATTSSKTASKVKSKAEPKTKTSSTSSKEKPNTGSKAKKSAVSTSKTKPKTESKTKTSSGSASKRKLNLESKEKVLPASPAKTKTKTKTKMNPRTESKVTSTTQPKTSSGSSKSTTSDGKKAPQAKKKAEAIKAPRQTSRKS
ncbi:regulator of chromosome condensation RCC1 [Cryptosporidium felis]|nr:regulator of chromosome condensation RCC1 [Cryptosporidium felis]